MKASLALAVTLLALVLSGCTMGTLPSAGSGPIASSEGSAAVVELSAVSPSSGSLSGGESVMITGMGLSGVESVFFGDQLASEITVVDDATVTAVVPHAVDYVAGAAVTIAVVTADAVTTSTLSYTYEVVTAVDRQLQYAFAHWNDYNLGEYGDFTTWGGDCMNFVSQTLVARGWAVTSDWFNDAQEDWAAAFVHVPSFDEWLSSHPEYGATRLTLAEKAQTSIGDIVMFDWDGDGSLDHAQVISGFDGDEVLMVGHDMNSTYRSITLALEQQGTPAAAVYFWSLPDA